MSRTDPNVIVEQNDGYQVMNLEVELPNALNLRWRFYFLASVYKSMSKDSFMLSVISLLITSVWYFFCGMYIFVFLRVTSEDEIEKDIALFPHLSILKNIFSGTIYTYSILYVAFIIYLVTIIVFLISLFNPNLLYNLHFVLSIRIHSILYPLTTTVATYSLVLIASIDEVSTLDSLFHSFNVFSYVIYLGILCTLTYVDTNSIINQNSVISEGFTGLMTPIPLLVFFNTLSSIQSLNFNLNVRISFLVINTLLNFGYMLLLVIQLPLLNDIVNALIAALTFTVATISVLHALYVTVFEFKNEEYIIIGCPLVYLMITYVIDYIAKITKSKSQGLYNTFVNIRPDEISAVNINELNIKNERRLRLLIFDGLRTGNQIAFSGNFVRFCLKRFPKSSWLSSYVAFLYVTKWGLRPELYKFLLHIISTDKRASNLQLFQALYCFQQVSDRLSPLISRELDQYRSHFSVVVNIHRALWTSILEGDKNKFIELFKVYTIERDKLKKRLDIMNSKYHYCHSIQFENALYYADFKHEFVLSSVFVDISKQLSTDKAKFILNDFVKRYNLFFPLVSDANKTSIDLAFPSFINRNEKLHFRSVMPKNDVYINTYAKMYDIPVHKQPIQFRFDRRRRFFIHLILALLIISFILQAYTLLRVMNIYSSVYSMGLLLSQLVYKTNDFSNVVDFVQQDILLLYDVINKSYDEVESLCINYVWSAPVLGSMYNLTKDHISTDYYKINEYKNYITLFSTNSPVNIEFSLKDCSGNQCGYLYLFSGLYYAILTIYRGNIQLDLLEGVIDKMETHVYHVKSLISHIYTQIDDEKAIYVKRMNDTFDMLSKIYLALILFSFIFIFLYWLILCQMRTNVYDVVKTIQPFIVKDISMAFRRLNSENTHMLHSNKLSKSKRPILLFIASILVPFICFIYVLASFKRLVNLSTSTSSPSYDVQTQKSSFLTYALSFVELLGIGEIITSTDFLYTANSSNLHSGSACAHHLYENACDACYNVSYTTTYSSNLTLFLKILNFTLICVGVFVIFIYLVYPLKSMTATASDMIKYVPHKARDSNPVLSSLIKAERVSCDPVKLTKLVSSPFDGSKSYALFIFDENGYLCEHLGCSEIVSYFFPTVSEFSSLNDIVEKIKEHTSENHEYVDAFFKGNYQKKSVSLFLEDFKELAFSLSNERTSLLVRDNSCNNAECNLKRTLRSFGNIGTPVNELSKAFLLIAYIPDKNKRNIYIERLSMLQATGTIELHDIFKNSTANTSRSRESNDQNLITQQKGRDLRVNKPSLVDSYPVKIQQQDSSSDMNKSSGNSAINSFGQQNANTVSKHDVSVIVDKRYNKIVFVTNNFTLKNKLYMMAKEIHDVCIGSRTILDYGGPLLVGQNVKHGTRIDSIMYARAREWIISSSERELNITSDFQNFTYQQ